MRIGLAGAQQHSIASTQQRHLCFSPCAGPCTASRSGITTCLTSAMWQMYYCWYICGYFPTQHTCTRCVAALHTARCIPCIGSCTCSSTLVTIFADIVALKSVAALCCSVSCSDRCSVSCSDRIDGDLHYMLWYRSHLRMQQGPWLGLWWHSEIPWYSTVSTRYKMQCLQELCIVLFDASDTLPIVIKCFKCSVAIATSVHMHLHTLCYHGYGGYIPHDVTC